MPRGSKPGERRGGRQKGTPNKATVAKAAALKAASADPTATPLQFLLGVMRDPSAPPALRVQVARAAAPLVHAKPGIASPVDRSGTGSLRETDGFAIDIEEAKALRDMELCLDLFGRKRWAPSENGGPPTATEIEEEAELRKIFEKRVMALVCPGYGLDEVARDGNRLHQLHCKRLSPPSCGGGELSHEDDEEEALLTARAIAYRYSQEGRDRRRIMNLEIFTRNRNAIEQAELEKLRLRYPESPTNRVSATSLAIAEFRNRKK
jgi:hypothetical protein